MRQEPSILGLCAFVCMCVCVYAYVCNIRVTLNGIMIRVVQKSTNAAQLRLLQEALWKAFNKMIAAFY